MKKINYIFYTGVVAIIFLIVSPIYWQYEVNEFHDASHFYSINDFEGETVEKSYEVLENIASSESNTFYIVRPTNSQGIDLLENKFYFSSAEPASTYNVEEAIKFSIDKSDFTSFSESNGYFYSDMDYEKIETEFSAQGLDVLESEDIYENDLRRYVVENALPVFVVILFTLIINIVLTLKDIKEVALLSLQGVSDFRIKLRLSYRTFIALLKTVSIIFLFFTVYKIVQGNHLSLVFFKFYFSVIVIILATYTLVYFLSLVATSSVDIISVLKNKDYSTPVYILLLAIQSIIIILVPILFSGYLNNYDNVKQVKNEIARVYELENYYSYYGVNTNFYESLSDTELTAFNEDFKRLYNDNINKSYYFEPQFSQHTSELGESIYQIPVRNIVYMDSNYYNEIADLSQKNIEEIENGTLLIPILFKENTDEIVESISVVNKDLNIIYIDDNIELYFDDFNPEYTFSDDHETFSKKGMNNVIVIVNPNDLENINPYANTQFIERMTSGYIFFKEDSLDVMINKTQEYNLDKMVTAESKISPYQDLLYNIEYTYKIITYTLVLTLISVIITNTFASEIIINKKKKLIAIGFLNGKNIMYSLKNNFILYTVVSLISVGALLFLNMLTIKTFIVILTLYLYVCLYLSIKYYNFINNKITTLLKGE